MNTQQMMEEIDRLTRLCEAKDAEIARITEIDSLSYRNVLEQLSEAQAQMAMLRNVAIEYSECTWPCEVDYGVIEPRRSCCDTSLDSEHASHCTAAKAIEDTQATALAYEREVENRGAVKELEKLRSIFAEYESDEVFIETVLDHIDIELRAANKGKE